MVPTWIKYLRTTELYDEMLRSPVTASVCRLRGWDRPFAVCQCALERETIDPGSMEEVIYYVISPPVKKKGWRLCLWLCPPATFRRDHRILSAGGDGPVHRTRRFKNAPIDHLGEDARDCNVSPHRSQRRRFSDRL